MYVPVEKFVEPERVLVHSVVVQIVNVRQVLDGALPTKRCQRASVRVHRRKYDSGVLDLPLNIFRTIVPVHSEGIDWCTLFTICGKKFHDAGEVVRLSGRLADEVGVI